jgi:hypothetical protein
VAMDEVAMSNLARQFRPINQQNALAVSGQQPGGGRAGAASTDDHDIEVGGIHGGSACAVRLPNNQPKWCPKTEKPLGLWLRRGQPRRAPRFRRGPRGRASTRDYRDTLAPEADYRAAEHP